MPFITKFIDFILHIDKYLSAIIQQYGTLTYVLLFLMILLETGLVLTPILPGDSLLFAAGTFAGIGSLNVFVLFFTLSIASILGDTMNYSIGKLLGSKAFEKYPRVFKKEYLDKTHKFYEKYGAKTIIFARFVPIVRTFAPFIAGVGTMKYIKFLMYNVIGGILWVALFVFGGYFFGNVQLVKDNFSIVIMTIIVLSFVPMFWELWKHKHNKEKQLKAQSG